MVIRKLQTKVNSVRLFKSSCKALEKLLKGSQEAL